MQDENRIDKAFLNCVGCGRLYIDWVVKQPYRIVKFCEACRSKDSIEKVKQDNQTYLDSLGVSKSIVQSIEVTDEFKFTPTEQYLIDDYNVYESEDLRKESQIFNHFVWSNNKHNSSLLVKIGAKFYEVALDYKGGSIANDVQYKEVPKPQPKKRITYNLQFTCTQEEYLKIKDLLDKLNIIFEVK